MEYLTAESLRFNFAMVTAAEFHDRSLIIHGETSDCTSFLNWLRIWVGVHYNYDKLSGDYSILLNYKVVMLSGNPAYFKEIIAISEFLKGKVLTVFLPEGDISLYDIKGINSFFVDVYKAFDSTDVIFSMEEDKIAYYSCISNTPAVFVHVPTSFKMDRGDFRLPVYKKSEHILIYGDNNPNCPITVVGIAKKIGKPLITVCIEPKIVEDIQKWFSVKISCCFPKLGQYPFLDLLGRCWLHIYPTRWIGSAREVISCAVAGTPCIGSDRSHTQRRLFPELAVDIYDVDKMVKLAEKLYFDIGFYNSVCDYAWENVHFYNEENTKKRFVEACNVGIRRLNDKLLCSN